MGAQNSDAPRGAYRQYREGNSRAEHAYQPTRQRAQRMQRCQSLGQASGLSVFKPNLHRNFL